MRTTIYLSLYIILILILEAIIDMPEWVKYIWAGGILLIFFEEFYRVVIKKETKYRVICIEEKRGAGGFWIYFTNEIGKDDGLRIEEYLYKKVNEGETIGIIYRGIRGLIIVKSNGTVIRTKWYWYLISKNEKHIKAVCVELLKAVRASNKK